MLGCSDQSDDDPVDDKVEFSNIEISEEIQKIFSCLDVEGLTEPESAMRTTFQYTDRSMVMGRSCANCALFVVSETGAGCGACLTIKGPIHPKGYCTIWAAQTG